MFKNIQRLASQAEYKNNLRRNKSQIIASANEAWDNRPVNSVWAYEDYVLSCTPFVDYGVQDSVKLSILSLH